MGSIWGYIWDHLGCLGGHFRSIWTHVSSIWTLPGRFFLDLSRNQYFPNKYTIRVSFFVIGCFSGGLFGQVVAHGLRSCCSALLVLLSFFRVVLLIGTCCSLASFVFRLMFFLGWLTAFPRYLRCFLAFSPPPPPSLRRRRRRRDRRSDT